MPPSKLLMKLNNNITDESHLFICTGCEKPVQKACKNCVELEKAKRQKKALDIR